MQPGIESLSQNQLSEMKKGVSPLQNLQTVKWSSYYDIHLAWNILLGFPGETNEDYRRQIDLILSILHFQPPEAVGEIWIERFSPYWKWPEQNGIRITGPGLAYEYGHDQAGLERAATEAPSLRGERPLLHPRPPRKQDVLTEKGDRLLFTLFRKRSLSPFSPDYFFSGIVMIIPPITSFSLKFFFGLSG